MKTALVQIRVEEKFKANMKAYAKRNKSDVSKITVGIWEIILNGEKISKR